MTVFLILFRIKFSGNLLINLPFYSVSIVWKKLNTHLLYWIFFWHWTRCMRLWRWC